MLLLAFLLPFALCYHCEYDSELGGVGNVEVNINPRDDIAGKSTWVSNMQFFLFGELGDNPESAVVSAGFYRTNGELVYKLLVTCATQEWKTMYARPGSEKVEFWKKGTLARPCRKGRFDITYELQNRRRGKFLFNGSKAEGELQEQLKMSNKPPRKLVPTGRFRIEELPVNLKQGKVFKASISAGHTLQRTAYGKCFAFPSGLTNCVEALEWVKLRSKINGTFSIEGKKGVAFEGLAEYGAWSLAFHPICNGTHLDQFARIQTGIMPDQLSTDREGHRSPYCCCANSKGVLEGRCAVYNWDNEDTKCTVENLCHEEMLN